MKSLKHAWLIAGKDLRRFSGDRRALFFSLLFPFLFVGLFGSILSSVDSEDERMTLHIVTREDAGGISRLIARSMETEDEADLDPGEPVIVWDKSYDEDLQAVTDGHLEGFLSFPEDFTDAISRGYRTTIEVVTEPDATYTRAALNSVAEAIAAQIGHQQVAKGAITALMVEGWLDSPGDTGRVSAELPLFLSIQAGVPMRASLIEYAVDQAGPVEGQEPVNYVIPGYLVMFVFMSAASAAEAIVRERQNFTLERLLTTSVSREAILAGTFAGMAARGLVQIFLFWTVGILLYHMDLGTAPGAVVVLSLIMVVMSSAFALMLATLARTQRSAASIATVTSLALAPLGGCWWPLFITPRWMQFLAKLTPHGWATTGFNKLLLFGADFSSVVPEMAAVLGFAALFGTIAIWRFHASAV
jgi:ABC-2 type transport system permease protein